jgi:hypothetical protein
MSEPIDVRGDFTPVPLLFGGVPHVACVGDAGSGVARVTVNGHYCEPGRGLWASPPIPYAPGMEVVVVFTDGRGRDREVRASLPGPDQLAPVFSSSWALSAPLK